MPINICSLNYAIRLKVLGIKQESSFFWIIEGHPFIETHKNAELYSLMEKASAFSEKELKKIIPPKINYYKKGGEHSESNEYSFYTEGPDADLIYTVYYHQQREHNVKKIFQCESKLLSDALAKMVITLISNGIIKT